MNRDRCCEDRAYCRSCPERCFPDAEPMEAKTPTALDRIAYGLSQWAALLFGIAKAATAMRRVKG